MEVRIWLLDCEAGTAEWIAKSDFGPKVETEEPVDWAKDGS